MKVVVFMDNFNDRYNRKIHILHKLPIFGCKWVNFYILHKIKAIVFNIPPYRVFKGI